MNTTHFVRIAISLILCFNGINTFAQQVGNYVSFIKTNTELRLKGTTGDILIQVLGQNIFKIQMLKTNQIVVDSSYTIILKPQRLDNPIKETSETIEIQFEKCVLQVDKYPLRVGLKSGNSFKIQEDEGFTQTPDSVYLSFRINPKDIFHGAGARPFGLDLNKKVFDFYNTYEPGYYEENTKVVQGINIPFLVSSHRYGLLVDSQLPGSMRMYVGALDSTKLNIQINSKGHWAYYLINGDSNDEILAGYTLLTGRQPLPPRWAFGYLQSKYGYRSEEEAISVVSKLRAQGFPIDALILDLYWYGNETKMGNLDWDLSKWPNPTKMMGDFSNKGVKTILISDPYVTINSSNFKIADSLGYLAKDILTHKTSTFSMWNGVVGLLDIYQSSTQKWLWNNYKRLINQGVSGWWSDKVEPETHPLNLLHPIGSTLQVHNLYPLIWAQNMSEGYRIEYPQKRLFHLIRSAYTGAQRYGVLPWSGDVTRYWAGLNVQIPIMLQSGMSGLAYMHSDVGGFFTDPSQKDKNEELDLRWLQMSVFSPMVRVHGLRENIEPYNLSEPFGSIFRNYLNIRYKLLPYIYTLAWQNTTTGRPICLPMDYFEFDKSLGNNKDQYFFGENLLVAPVLLHGMLVRKVVLPKGKWFNFWTNELHDGNNNVFNQLSLEHIPVYAKAGSIIPLAQSAKVSTEYYTSDSLLLKYFQDISVPSTTFTMYHDDGNNPQAIASQQFEQLQFSGQTWTDSIAIQLNRTHTFKGGLSTRAMVLEVENLTSIPKSVKINNQNVAVVLNESAFNKDFLSYYNVATKQLKIRYLWNCNERVQISIERNGLAIITGIDEELAESSFFSVHPNPVQAGQNITITTNIPSTGRYTLELLSEQGTVLSQVNIGKQSKGVVLKQNWEMPVVRGVHIIRLIEENGIVVSKKIVIF